MTMDDGALTTRRLAPADLDAVVAIDASIVGRSRRSYFERRLRAAIEAPTAHVQLAIDRGGALAGYVLARKLAGELGLEPALRLEVIGVKRDAAGQGIGQALFSALSTWARDHGLFEIRTQASWRDHEMLRFFHRAGFELAEDQVMDADLAAAQAALHRQDEEREEPEEERLGEIDYGAPPRDGEGLARDRIDVRVLTAGDAADLARIDRKLTGRDRSAYIAGAVDEALRASAVRVSLTARKDGMVVGFVMAKTDYGDYGRAEPVAVLDLLGVDPSQEKHGVGTGLLSQLFLNLRALGVERVETVVSRGSFGLLAFLYKLGFGPSPRLGFVRRLG
jgi:GNAT superfamily N-acetyltransferase